MDLSRTKLTDKQKKKIIADYVLNQNYSETARLNKISNNTVKKIVKAEKDISEKFSQKKEEDNQDMMQYLEEKKKDAFKFIDMAFAGMMDEEKIKKTPVNQLATALGIVIDKYTKNDTGEGTTKVVIINDIPKDD